VDREEQEAVVKTKNPSWLPDLRVVDDSVRQRAYEMQVARVEVGMYVCAPNTDPGGEHAFKPPRRIYDVVVRDGVKYSLHMERSETTETRGGSLRLDGRAVVLRSVFLTPEEFAAQVDPMDPDARFADTEAETALGDLLLRAARDCGRPVLKKAATAPPATTEAETTPQPTVVAVAEPPQLVALLVRTNELLEQIASTLDAKLLGVVPEPPAKQRRRFAVNLSKQAAAVVARDYSQIELRSMAAGVEAPHETAAEADEDANANLLSLHADDLQTTDPADAHLVGTVFTGAPDSTNGAVLGSYTHCDESAKRPCRVNDRGFPVYVPDYTVRRDPHGAGNHIVEISDASVLGVQGGTATIALLKTPGPSKVFFNQRFHLRAAGSPVSSTGQTGTIYVPYKDACARLLLLPQHEELEDYEAVAQ
jgi:hypothetical protein